MGVNTLILPSKQMLWGNQGGFSWLFHLCFSRYRDEEWGPVALGCLGGSAVVAHWLTDVCAMVLSAEARGQLEAPQLSMCTENSQEAAPLEGSPGNISFQPQERSNETLRNAAQRDLKGQSR